MKLGSDFFLILKIVFAVVKALIELFGDDEDVENGHRIGL